MRSAGQGLNQLAESALVVGSGEVKAGFAPQRVGQVGGGRLRHDDRLALLLEELPRLDDRGRLRGQRG